MVKKLNLHWGVGKFYDFRLFGNSSHMKDKMEQFKFCIDYIQKNEDAKTEANREEIKIYRDLIKIYERRINSEK